MSKVKEATRVVRMAERARVLDPSQLRELLETLDLEREGPQAERLREQLQLRKLIRRDWQELTEAGKTYFRALVEG